MDNKAKAKEGVEQELKQKKDKEETTKEVQEKVAVEEKKQVEEKKAEETTKKEKEIKIFTIPLKKAFRKSMNRRAEYSIRLIKEFLQRHLKSNNIKLGKHLNEAIWERGIKKPPRRVKVKVTFVDDEYRAELFGYDYEVFKPKPGKKKEGLSERLASRLGVKALKKQEEERLVEGKKK